MGIRSMVQFAVRVAAFTAVASAVIADFLHVRRDGNHDRDRAG